MNQKFYLSILVTLVCSFASSAQVFTITQNVTGNHQATIRGQVFKPSEQGSGTGAITSSGTVYLKSFSVIYDGGAEAPTLYIYSSLPTINSSLDIGGAPGMVGESSSVTEDFPYKVYHFDHLPLDKNTTYYALFKQNVDLEYGASGAAAGPYAGGKRLINNGTAPVASDFTALKFLAEFDNTKVPNAGDVAALTALHNATDGANWTNKWNLASDPFTWYGVVWLGTRVVQLNISTNNLVGTLPTELGNLINLKVLYLAYNHLTGTLPSTFTNLTNLQYLYLRGNAFTSLGVDLGGLPLRTIDLGGIPLGSIPAWVFDHDLLGLYLDDCSIQGEIPAEIGNLVNMIVLDLSGNTLTGSIPSSLTNLNSLLSLRLSDNQLSGSIPSAIGNMTQLDDLFLSNNELTGSIPASLGNLSNLTWLSLRGNNLTGEIPPELGTMTSLQILSLADNLLEGSIPSSLGNLSNLQSLTLYRNSLSGILPATLTALTNLTQLRIDDNLFDFSSFELVTSFISSLAQKIITPQKKLPVNTSLVILPLGTQLQLNVTTPGANNLYQWFRNGTAIGSPGSTSQLTVSNFQAANVGTYVCEVTNTTVPGLTLESENIAVTYPMEFDNEYPSITNMKAKGFTINFNITKSGAVRYIMCPAGLPAPSVQQMVDSLDGIGQEALKRGAVSVASNQLVIANIDGLAPSTNYDIYAFAKDALVTSDIKKVSVTTDAGINFVNLYPKLLDVAAEEFTLAVKTTKAGVVYYVVLPQGATSPTAEQISTKKDATGAVVANGGQKTITANAELSVIVSSLTEETPYDIYLVAKDAESVFSLVQQITISTITGLEQPSNAYVKVFPNPVLESIMVHNTTASSMLIQLKDMQGRLVHSTMVHGENAKIDMMNIPQGLYFLHYKTLNTTGYIKLLKK